jgi:hypothetical protein
VQPSTPKAQLFVQALDCFHAQHCARTADTDCYCGTGVDPNACFSGSVSPTGPCKTEVEAAAESSVLGDINNRYFDPSYALGAATSVIETCDQFDCVEECL